MCFGGHVSISRHHRWWQCLAAAGSSYTWEASGTEVLPNGTRHALLLSQAAKLRKWSCWTHRKAKCGSTSPTQATEAVALRECSPSGAATRQLACQLLPFFQPAAAHLLLPSHGGVLHTCTLWPSRPPTARQRRVRPPLCKHWPQADMPMKRKKAIIAPSTGTGHAFGAHAAWGCSRRQ